MKVKHETFTERDQITFLNVKPGALREAIQRDDNGVTDVVGFSKINTSSAFTLRGFVFNLTI